MFCSRCGARLRARAGFCEECGAPRRAPLATRNREGIEGMGLREDDALVLYQEGGAGVAAGPRPARHLAMPPAGQALPATAWAGDSRQVAPAGPVQAIQFNPQINVEVAPLPPVAPPGPSTVVIVGGGSEVSLAAAAAWALGLAAALGLMAMVIAAFITADAAGALVVALPLLFAFYAMALVALPRRRH